MTKFSIPARSQRGFSLLEVLIAFSILALSLGILLRIFSGGVNNAAIAEEYTIAVQIAESLMARTGVESPLEAGELTGEQDNKKYRWAITVQPFNTGITTTNPKNLPVNLVKVKVTVRWGDDSSDDRQVELVSLRVITSELEAS